MWIGTDTVRRYMDPEERLWFLEEAVAAYLAEPEPAGDLVRAVLSAGKPVVTANKLLLAKDATLEGLGELRYSAAVGGAVPALEAVKARPK